MFNFIIIVSVIVGFALLVVTIILPAVQPMLSALPL